MPDLNPKRSARRHEQVRQQNASELAQDYVEAIHKLNTEGHQTRVTDLQDIFGVSHVTVIRALRRFEGQGLVSRSRKDGIQLTTSGKRLAIEAAERHALIVEFLVTLGISEVQADIDAEGIEHHLSDESLGALRRFLKSHQAMAS